MTFAVVALSVVSFLFGYGLGHRHGHESGHRCERAATIAFLESQGFIVVGEEDGKE